MDSSGRIKGFFYSPGAREEAAWFLRKCTESAAHGAAVRIRLVESPFHSGGSPDIGRSAAPDEIFRDIESSAGGPVVIDLCCRAMDAIAEISAADMLAVAGGAVTFGRLQEAAREKGLYFPFEPESFYGDRTLAGLVMDGTVSRFEGRYGRLRECLLSIEGVTAAGETFHTGSRSVKDVAGYELAGLLTGAGGRFAMITSVTLRLLRLPGTIMTVTLQGCRPELRELAGDIHRRLNPASMELYTKEESSALLVCVMHDNGAGREKAIESDIREVSRGRVISIAGSDAAAGRKILEPGFIHIAADIRAESPEERIGNDFSESLFPHRGHWLLSKYEFGPEGRFLDTENMKRFVARLAPGFRIRAEEISGTADEPVVRRIRPSAGTGTKAGADRTAGETGAGGAASFLNDLQNSTGARGAAAFLNDLESSEALDAVTGRLLDVFDPERIFTD